MAVNIKTTVLYDQTPCGLVWEKPTAYSLQHKVLKMNAADLSETSVLTYY